LVDINFGGELMKKYKNVGKTIGFVIDGKTFDFENGEVVAVPDNFKENIQDHLVKLEDVTPKSEPVEVVEAEKDQIAKIYSEKELFAMKKAEQIKILKGFGVDKIPRLEKGRVKKILELQK